jgi:GT2 family glycosyltransferase
MSQISVLIVSWNARAHLRKCLQSVRETGAGIVRELIVVDNASSDGSAEMVAEEFSEVKLIHAGANLGFSRANNLGLRYSSGSLVAFINSDVIVHPDCFEKLSAFLAEHPQVGLVGPKVVDATGAVQLTCKRLPGIWNTLCRAMALDRVLGRWSMFSGFEMRHLKYDCAMTVEALSGCFWLARRSAIDQVGGLDERFFFYAEDLDWCKRFGDSGWKLALVPEAKATHFGGGSSSAAPVHYSVQMIGANLAYWRKHYGLLGQCSYPVLCILHYGLRLIAQAIGNLMSATDSPQGAQKLREDVACLKWLMTRKGL